MSLKIKPLSKILLFQQKGFSLIELVVSIGAMGFFAILVQSMLLLGHSFAESQRNFFESAQVSSLIKQQICFKNSAFKVANLEPDRSYSLIETEEPGSDPPIISRQYRRFIMGSFAPKSKPLVRLKFSSSQQIKGASVEHYDVLQDSHTVISMKVDMVNLAAGGFKDGAIFASRCVKNPPDRIYAGDPGKPISTFDPAPNKRDESAVDILVNSPYRPYYFPKPFVSGTTTYPIDFVKCCENGQDEGTCVNNYVPRIYIIYLEPQCNPCTGDTVSFREPILDPPNPGHPFDGKTVLLSKVNALQEFPEGQDVANIWGAGFVVSMNQNIVSSQTRYRMELLILKNTCTNSTQRIQRCPDISLGENIRNVHLNDMDSSNPLSKMINYIHADVSSCTGFSSGIDTNSLITF